MLLDRLRADCEYFLGAGGRSEKHLWAGSVYAQIRKMRELYDALPEKPEWLTTEAIDRYAAQMAAPYQVAAYHHFENGFDDKLDYQTLEEAEATAQGYVVGTMEEDGFAYDGAAVYDAETHQCLRVYGNYPDEKAQEQATAFALEHDTAQQNTAELPAFLDMHLIEANLLDDGGRKHKRQEIFEYRGLTLELAFDTFAREYRLTMIGQLRHTVTLGTDVFGNLQRMDNALEGLPIKEQACREQLSNLQTQLETAKAEVQKPFPREAELNTKTARLEELNSLLNLDHKEPEIVDAEPDEAPRPRERPSAQMER